MAKNRPNKKKSKPVAAPTTAPMLTEETTAPANVALTDEMEDLIDSIIMETCVVTEPPEIPSQKQMTREAPVLTPVPKVTGQATPNITFDRSAVLTYNKHMCSAGDVVHTSGVFSDSTSDSEDMRITKSHRPALVIWEDGNLMRLLPLSTSPGSIGTVTGNRRSAIPSTPDLAKMKEDSVSYIDHAQCLTANCSQITSIPLRITKAALDQIMVEDIKMTYLERGGSVFKLLDTIYEIDPEAFKSYSKDNTDSKLKELIIRLQMDREMKDRRIKELEKKEAEFESVSTVTTENEKIGSIELYEDVLKKKDDEINRLMLAIDRLKRNSDEIEANLKKKHLEDMKNLNERNNQLQLTINKIGPETDQKIQGYVQNISALKREIVHLRNLMRKNGEEAPPPSALQNSTWKTKKENTVLSCYDVNAAAAAYNAWTKAKQEKKDKYQAFCNALGIEYPHDHKSCGQIKRHLNEILIEAKMLREGEWKK